MNKRETLGEFEHLVLLTIARIGGEAGGALIHRDLEITTKRGASLPAIYVTLGRLEKKGLVIVGEALPALAAGERKRLLFMITPAGLHALRSTRELLERMWRDVPLVQGVST
jgi:PadR family transcriptional regulator, regulatory protein PadR